MQLAVRDVARILNVPEKTVYRWISHGEIPSHKVHDQHFFNRAELLEWATARKLPVAVDLLHEPDDGGPLPCLGEALRVGGFHYRLPGADKATVLRSLVRVLPVSDPRGGEAMDRDFLYQVLLAREGLGSTGIGDGIAIPHVRNPIVLHVSRPSITLCFLERPVDFGALDRQPVHTLFSLISPTIRAHLHLLSRLAFVLRDQDLRAALGRKAPQVEILAQVDRVEECMRPRL